MPVLAADDDSEQTADEVDNLISYARFLERRAWREKINSDRHRLKHEWIDIQPSLAKAIAAEMCVTIQSEQPVMPNTTPGRELVCPPSCDSIVKPKDVDDAL
jgi:hypothetical protein